MRISVIIPCHGGVADTRACLASLQRAARPPGAELELLVVDNASPDATASLDRELSGVRVLPQPRNLGFAGGVNAGLRVATGSHLVVLNNDTLAAPSLLVRLVAAVESDPRIALAGPTSNHVKGPARLAIGDAGLAEADRDELDAVLAEDPRTLQDVPTLSGLCLAMRRAWFERIGTFDERFGSGNWEDDDYCLRARLLGARLVVVRHAFLHHRGHRTFAALGLDLRNEILKRRATFADKWRGEAAAEAYLAEYDGDLARAARRAARACAERPLWPDAARLLGRDALARGDACRARELLRSHLEQCPRASEPAVLLALAELESGALDAGLATFSSALRSCWFGQHETARALGLLADFWLRHDAPEHAEPLLDDALALAPDDGDMLNRLGVLHLHRHRHAEAGDAFRRAAAAGHELAAANLERLTGATATAR